MSKIKSFKRITASAFLVSAVMVGGSSTIANATTYHGPFRSEMACMFASGEYKLAAPYLERRCEKHDDGQWWFATK